MITEILDGVTIIKMLFGKGKLVDKREERVIFDMIYSASPELQVEELERPDFVVFGLDRSVGVEVTELYRHPVDAKMSKVPNYTLGLLNETQAIHRKDREYIKVDQVELKDENGQSQGKPMAIITEMPSIKERVELLMEVIKSKEQKARGYKEKCDLVDLVILDASSLFMHNSFDEFFKPFWIMCDNGLIKNSSFREIFLISSECDNRSVAIPLRANLFLADCFAFESFINDAKLKEKESLKPLDVLLASLYMSGHQDIRISGGTDNFSLHYGAWELLYSDEGKCIRDRTLVSEDFEFELLREIYGRFSNEVVSEAENFLGKRKGVYAAISLSFPVRAK
ncbi:hypothetical protein DT594_09430 [Halopseudomonas laoshanensis]|uniref:Uncharacterized protein n=1 Tax=Halopseudomonas laoshanensis TaxID=2268758 RepID=A0A7V7GUG6_9GAMM|nr:hypothetical protein [Halopseudomonas laoshanensis]KAA0695068.1 hypothetical protein DT594_09430 [Halopseudomonas laoshanensis]